MAELKEYIAKKDNGGSVIISEEVLASIAGVAAMEIEGVAALGTSSVVDILGGKNPSKGIKVQLNEGSVDVGITLTVKKGVVIPDIACKVQNNVATAIEDMTGIKVKVVNVKVASVAFEKEIKKKQDGTEA